MVLDFEYGVNTGNRFLQFVDHDEEPEDFIAAQAKEDERQAKKAPSKDLKQQQQPAKKVPGKPAASAASSAKTNKENLTYKTSSAEQRRQQSAGTPVFSDNNQQTRPDSGRGARGAARRAGPPYEGAGRGRSQRFNKFEGKGPANESSSFEQGGEGWSNEAGARAGRGRGGQRQGNFEGGRGFASRGRGRGGRGNFGNRAEDGPAAEESNWQQAADSNFEDSRSPFEQDVSPTERSFEPENNRRTNRGSHRGRAYRNYGDRDAEGQEDYRANRRQFDRQPRSFVSSVKPIEKKDGEGAHNWGNPTENPEEHPISDEITETAAQPSATAGKDWAAQMDEAEKQMTLDEYKKQQEERKRAHQDKLPQFNRREAGEGEDLKQWQKFEQEYRKRNEGDDEEEEEEEEGDEENESVEEYEEEQTGKKKNLISIPLRFKPIEMQRGSAGSRGGARRPGPGRFRPNRDEQQQRATSPSQGQAADEQQRSYRGGRPAGEQRRSNRGGYRPGRSSADPNAPALDNPEDFPTLPKQ